MFIIFIFTIISAIIGLYITRIIYLQKRKKIPLVCPFGADCNFVTSSKFSTFFGIKLELYGIVYYLMIIIVYLFFLIFPFLITKILLLILFGFAIAGFLFSIYLTLIQAFVIKSWCSWCLMSASISTIIFILSILGLLFY